MSCQCDKLFIDINFNQPSLRISLRFRVYGKMQYPQDFGKRYFLTHIQMRGKIILKNNTDLIIDVFLINPDWYEVKVIF